MMESIFTASVPLILAALGGLVSERAGVLNIALEGCMGAGAFTVVVLASQGLPLWMAVTSAVIVGILAGLLLGGVHLGLHANLFIAGLGVNILLPALSGLVSQILFGQRGVIRMGPPMEGTLLLWLMPPAALVMGLALHYTEWGRCLRAAGSGGEFLAERGISLKRVRMGALLVSSALAALSGATLSLKLGVHVPGMSAGKGWLALVAVWLGFRHPLGVLLACYIFTAFETVAGWGQGLMETNASLAPALPYLAALLALIIISAIKKAIKN